MTTKMLGYRGSLGLPLICFTIVNLPLIAALDLTQCRLSLGMQSFQIADNAITASSSYDPDSVGAENARIRMELKGGAWCPGQPVSKDTYEYLQIDFGELKVITLVETQGRFGNGQGQEFVDQYLLEYQREDGGHWFRFRNRRGQEIFQGNTNTYIAELRVVDPPIISRKIRFVPYSDHPKTVCLRVEVYGCPWTDGTVWYAMPQGERRGTEVDLYDFIYDGNVTSTQLSGGLGQLTDGEEGQTNFRLDQKGFGVKGYEWVGWRNDTHHHHPVSITFKFDTVRNFSHAIIHANNMFNKEVRVFRMAKAHFSIGGAHYVEKPIIYKHMRDSLIEYARPVRVPLNHQLGRFLNLHLFFDAKWMMISEVTFFSEPAIGNFTVEKPPPATHPHLVEVIEIPNKNHSSRVISTYDSLGEDSDLDSRQGSQHGHVTHRPVMADSKTLANDTNLDEDKEAATVGILDSSKSTKDFDTQYIGIIIGALSALILLLFVVILIIILRQRRQKYNNNHRPMKVVDPPPRHITLDLNDLQQNTLNGKLTNGSMYNHVSTSDVEGELLKIANKDMYGTPLGMIQGRRLPPPPHTPDSVSDNNMSLHYAVPDLAKLMNIPPTVSPHTAPLSPPSVPPPPSTLPKPSYYSSNPVSYAGTPQFNSLRPGAHYAASDVTNLPNIQGVSGNNVYAVPNPDMLWQEDNTVTEFPRENLSFVEKLGEGLFGEVHLCEAKDMVTFLGQGDDIVSTLSGSRSMMVAVKMLRKSAEQPARRDFHKEVQIMARLKDPNIVRVLGVCTREDPLCVIVEYMKYGDLNQFLQGHVLDNTATLPKRKSGVKTLSQGCLTYMAMQAASGMKYLETLNMVHRDLAARNCLVGPMYTIKIADFGMSRSLYSMDYYRIEGRAVLPIRWMAWESILLGKFSTKTDVWSFGVTLWEIFMLCKEQPFDNLTDEQVIENCGHYYRNDGLEMYLPCPPGCPREFYDLMRESWNREDLQRPSFREIHMFLQRKNMGYDPSLDKGISGEYLTS